VGGVTEVDDEERFARLRLSRLAEPGDARLGAVLAATSGREVLDRIECNDQTLKSVEHYRARLSTSATADRERLATIGARYLVPGDGEWPTQLAALGAAAPWGLFVWGSDLRLAAVRSVAVVGSRAATQYGLHVASELATDLGIRRWTVVSGGAYGIDAAAHRGALAAGGVTVAALAFGIDTTYPRGHTALFERIRVEGGVLVSELPPGTTPTRPRFLTRNRVIAALTRGTVVVEAAFRSGALNTAATCRSLGRPVLAVPGSVESPMSVGCHRLIRSDDPARLITDAAEVIEEVGMIGELAPVPRGVRRVRDSLDPMALRLMEALPADRVVTLEEASVGAGIGQAAAMSLLLQLVALGVVTEVLDGFLLVAGAADVVQRRDR
jgi:DNA processing protein